MKPSFEDTFGEISKDIKVVSSVLQFITETFATVTIGAKTGQFRDFKYFHVAIYCGRQGGKHWVSG